MFHEDLKKIVEVELLSHIDLNKRKIMLMWDVIHNSTKHYSDPKFKRLLRIKEIKVLLQEFINYQLENANNQWTFEIAIGGTNHTNLNRSHFELFKEFVESG